MTLRSSARTNVLNSNTQSAMQHMLSTATRHPFITLGLATGLAYALVAHHNPDNRPEQPTSPTDMESSGVGGVSDVVRAVFADQGMPGPVMEGYQDPQTARLQMDGRGYESRSLPPAQSQPPALSMLDLPPVERQTPMSAPRMSGVHNYRYAPGGRMGQILKTNHF